MATTDHNLRQTRKEGEIAEIYRRTTKHRQQKELRHV
jgi:hypothetical protein